MRFNFKCVLAGEESEIQVSSVELPDQPNCYRINQNNKFCTYLCKINGEYRSPRDSNLSVKDMDTIGERIEEYLLRHSG